MSLTNSPWMYSSSGGFYNEVATQSLRFDDGSTAYLTRTPSSAGNRKTWTMSFWIKFSSIKAQTLFATRTDTAPYGEIRFESDGGFFFYGYTGSAYQYRFDTTQLFRDTSAWYHFVFAMDTTQSTESNRTKIYVNGSQITAFDNETYPTQNVDTNLNTTVEHDIGYDVNSSVQAFDGYMAEYNFIDGSALDPTSFGETKNGVWIAKEYTGSYGTNGFRLQFNQTGTGTASSSTIGADTSGNANHFSSSGIVADDCNRTDSPENNHATLNPLQAVINDNSTKPTLSDGNLVMSTSTADYQGFSSTMAIPTEGKYAFKVKMNTESSTQTHRFGVGTSISGNGIATDLAGNASGWHNAYVFVATVPRFDKNLDGAGQVNGSTLSPATVAGDEIEFLVDMDNGTIDTKLNGSTYGTQLTGMPTDKPLFPFATVYESSSGTTTLTFTFDYTPSDSNYLTICTANLPEPTISPNEDTQADDYFSPTLYTSDNIGAGGTQSVAGVGFQPDWVWIKNRSSSGTSHTLFDSVRTAGKMLQSDSSSLEASNSQYGYLSSFDSDGSGGGGFTLTGGTTNANFINQGTDDYVSWNWKANAGVTVSHSAGDNSATEASVSQANTTSGFSIVTYTGDTTGHGSTYPSTFNHGLGLRPKMIIVKAKDSAQSWAVYHDDMNGTSSYNHAMFLDLTNQKSSATNAYWGGNAMTLNTNLFSVGSDNTTGANGVNYVAYCFAEIEGYSKFGSYVGNGDPDGTFVYTGFRPAFCMWKRTDVSGGMWQMMDTTRDTFNVMDLYLQANSPNPEADFDFVDFVSNGFKHRHNSTHNNASGGTYIYMAFAETPTKYSLGR